MTNYLHTASGLLDGAFPWSITAKSTSTESESQAETAWANGMANLWGYASWIAFMPAMTSLTETSTSTADAVFHQTTKTVTTHNIVGTSASPSLPFRTASIVTLRTAQSTRWGRGRWYLPAPATNALATNGYYFSQAYCTALNGAVDSAFTQFSGAIVLQILHRKATKSGPGADTLTPVTGHDVSDEPATRRRRADKRVPIRTSG